jgi:outer membrane immunogenic protein
MALSKFEGPNYDINGIGSAGFLTGILGGGEMQLGPSFVAGIEGEYSWTNVGINVTGPSGGADSFWAVRGRLGYLATPGTMIYATGGIARIRLPNVESSGFHDGDGAEFGGGIETFLLPGLSLRAEYLYTVMDKNSISQFDVGERTTGGAARLALTGHFGG